MRFLPDPLYKLAYRFIRSAETNGVSGAIAHANQRLFRALRNHGLGGTLSRAFYKAPVPAAAIEPTAQPLESTHPFDLLHGTDTGGYLPGAMLPGISFSSLYTTCYLGISPSVVTQAISRLPLQPSRLADFSFVDIGCGKGRALLVAAQFPFRNLLGVELDPELSRIAQSNIVLRPDWGARISILNQDATTVPFPNTPLVLFLYDPFRAPVLRRALANLERQLRQSPRETYILYANYPMYTEVMERFPFLRVLSDTSIPLSAEDAAAQRFHYTEERFHLFASDLTR